jgi:lysophospholipase L1-like esterase
MNSRFAPILAALTVVACAAREPGGASGGSDSGNSSAGAGSSSGGHTSGSAGTPPSAGGLPSAGNGSTQPELGGSPASAGSSGSGSGSGGAGAAATGGAPSNGGASHWVGTWACAPQTTEPNNLPPSPGLSGNTLRQMVRVSIGGTVLRLRLSNEYGTNPVSLSSAHVALSKGGGAIDTTTDKALRFAGTPTVTIAAGASVWSDALDFDLAPLSNLAITLHFASQSGDVTGHPGSRTTSYLQSGEAVTAASFSAAVKTEHWYFITGLDVMADKASAAVVVLGDSITDGRGSTTNQNDRWPDVLAERLQARASTSGIGVLNMGIGGNAILSGGLGPTATKRFDHDVLEQSGVRWLIVLEGVNDIGAGGDSTVASKLIDAYQAFIAKTKPANLRAYGVPILPIAGSAYAGGESARSSVNEWIRTSLAFDAVIDLDAAVRDPADPTRLLALYDSGDHLHPSAAGYRKMGEAIDLALFSP